MRKHAVFKVRSIAYIDFVLVLRIEDIYLKHLYEFYKKKKAPDLSSAISVVAGAGLEPTSAFSGYEPKLIFF